MENVSKALIIAGGILLSVMILSLLVMFWGQVSGYFEKQHNSKMIEQDTEFNAKFENYNGQTIRGTELISIMNKVVNYNTSISEEEGSNRIIMSIDFKGYQNTAFQYPESTSIFKNIIDNTNMLSNKQNDNSLSKIANLSGEIVADTGLTDTQLQKLSAEIQNIVIDNKLSNREKSELEATRLKKLQNILGKSKADSLSKDEMSSLIEATKKYYQFTQLKRAMFKCTGVQHNTTDNGRINGLTFELVIENGNVKFN